MNNGAGALLLKLRKARSSLKYAEGKAKGRSMQSKVLGWLLAFQQGLITVNYVIEIGKIAYEVFVWKPSSMNFHGEEMWAPV